MADTGVLALLNFTHLVSTAGYAAIFILCVLQSCCVPTSSELTMGFAGALAAQGKLSIAGVILVGALGEVVGAYIAWAVGRYAGRAVVDRFGKYILLSHHDLDRAEAWYDRHERFGVFGSRLLPVIRNFVALPAGIAEVPLLRFGLLTAAGSLLWDGAWAGIGYGVGAHWHTIAKAFGDIGYVLAVLIVAAIAYAAYHRYRSYKEATTGGGGEDGGRAEGRHVARTSDGESPGSVRWLSSSSGRPPASTHPAGTQSAGTHPAGTHPAGTPSASPRALGHPAGAAQAEDRPLARSSGRQPPRPRRGDFPDSPLAAWEAAVERGRKEPEARGED